MDKFYKNNSNPLEEIELSDLKAGELFVSSTGIRYEYIGEGSFITNKSSELWDGEVMEELSPKAVGLYWILMHNRTLK